ncbi:hypothetical protein [Carnobacterium iners]|uniref:hypothetical protein n=1 Tax=Carnobacterium iners TaxID=1073423 RepID=UPI000A1CA1CB|nr:hypothetical protein [Carnobacterium iners]
MVHDKDNNFIHSFSQNIDFTRINNEIKEETGTIIDSKNFRSGYEIKIDVTYTFNDETEKSFTTKTILEEQVK